MENGGLGVGWGRLRLDFERGTPKIFFYRWFLRTRNMIRAF